MKFVTGETRENIMSLSRILGYRPLSSRRGELNCVRPIGGARYPRLHLFIKEDKDEIIFNLHLDQKKPSYSGSLAHSGEYEGEIIEGEAKRIKKIVEGLK